MKNKEEEMSTYLYVSSWNEHGGALGLKVYHYDGEEGSLSDPRWIDTKNSFGVSQVDERRRLLYVSNEVADYPGADRPSGRIFVYRLKEDGSAILKNTTPTGCPNPSYLSTNKEGTYLYVSHHAAPRGPEAAVQVWRLDQDGSPKERVQNINHRAYGEGKEAHPHSAVLSPRETLLAVADKGTGYLYLYQINKEGTKKDGQLKLKNKILTDREGAHPRLVHFDETLPYIFVNHEASLDGHCIISSFHYGEDGTVSRVDHIDALETPRPDLVGAPIRLEQQGFVINSRKRCLYTIINGANVLAVIHYDTEGKLTRAQNLKIDGIWPRGLAISPDGRYVLTSCLDTGEIRSYRVKEDGTLEPGKVIARQQGASWMTFWRAEG